MTADHLDLEVGLYVAELSESFMGPQDVGWNCGYSNGEALSRFCAEQETPAGTMDAFALAVRRGIRRVARIGSTRTDQDPLSVGCGIVYLYWMRSLGFSISQIVHAGRAMFSANYQALTGNSTAYRDLLAAVSAVSITSDNPFDGRA